MIQPQGLMALVQFRDQVEEEFDVCICLLQNLNNLVCKTCTNCCYCGNHAGGGKTVVGNLRIMQWQAYQKKKHRLEFLVPWWDLQHGVSINQFLSTFVSKNAEFRLAQLALNHSLCTYTFGKAALLFYVSGDVLSKG